MLDIAVILKTEIIIFVAILAFYNGYLQGRKRKIWKLDETKTIVITLLTVIIVLVTTTVGILIK